MIPDTSDEVASALYCATCLLDLAGVEALAAEPQAGRVLAAELADFGRRNQVKLRLKKLGWRKLRPDMLPCAYRRGDGGFAVLARMDQTQALIQSPGQAGPMVMPLAELEADWRGEVLCLAGAALRFDLSWFVPAFARHRRLLGEVLLFSFLLQFLALLPPLAFQVVMDKVLVHNALATLDVIVLGLVLAALVEALLKGLREYLLSHTSTRIDERLGGDLVRHLLGLPLAYFRSRQVGAIVSRVREADTIREFLTGAAMGLSVDLVFTLVLLGVMALLSPKLTCLLLLSLPLYALIAWRATPGLQARIETMFLHGARSASLLAESLAAVETIKGLAVEPRMSRRWEETTRDQVASGFSAQTRQVLISQSVQWVQKVVSVLILWLGAHEVMQLRLTVGQLIAFNMLASQASQPVTRLVDLWQQFIQARVAVDRLGEMLNLPVEQDAGSLALSGRLRGEIELRDVAFRYRPELAPALDGVSLTIPAGQTLGIVGPSGSGKSTLTKLVQKLYLPQQGEIYIDGQPLSGLNPSQLRQRIGVVLQENFLFHRSVRDNIALREPATPLEDVMRAAQLAGAHDFILKLPMGYDTVLAEGGSSLSGGQRQRLAIARALLSDPAILIFDEATSALDEESQQVIRDNMPDIARGRTVLIVAHRLSTIRDCDRIAVLEGGKVIESGSHAELLAKGATYRRLWRLQQDFSTENEHEA
ncbi:peptidase domain-containing ABC transporter [Duganella violaceipulchra]|uniref:Cyclolysin secretion/processing ATP-binding protein CyaB n=1 Tax=Duganella violaceipulchra TaxID=2849652 RepID=A0AA41HDD5_9BURK|nr:peptidase domain-containing ABC transporter [Duganella violaceicalia]MBV6322474.1 peptidase domain-containing ABC transporter [Duganella violaceicalia]MCP2010679.1 ATP-binding cassette subfamily B protein RtxB [Duganella violaceicalia]